MNEKYKILVNDDYEYSLDEPAINDLDIINSKASSFHIIEKNESYKATLIKADFQSKIYEISVNGNSYSIQIKDELDGLIKDLGLTINGKQKDSNVKAPMPGIILEIQVENGQEVIEGDGLLVLEAMKMENVLTAPKNGKIKSIHIKKGMTVEKGELLIEME